MRKTFTAEIKKQEKVDGTYVEIPFDVEEVFGGKRIKVKAYFDGAAYRGSIVRMGGRYILGITQAIRKEIGKNPGDIVTVEVEKDEEERVVDVPEDFLNALKEEPLALEYFEELSFSHKKEYVQWITSAKRADTRGARIEKAIAMLSESKKLK